MQKKHRKKNSLTLKLIYLLIITLMVISFSMARYRTTFDGNLQGDTANWIFTVNGQSQTFTIDLANTIDENSSFANKYAHEQGYIAPGAKGEFTITIDCTNCDVATDYEILITPHGELPEEFYIYSLSLNQNQTTIMNQTILKTMTLEEIHQNPTSEINIQWMWQLNSNVDESNFEGQNIQIDITVTGKQHI